MCQPIRESPTTSLKFTWVICIEKMWKVLWIYILFHVSSWYEYQRLLLNESKSFLSYFIVLTWSACLYNISMQVYCISIFSLNDFVHSFEWMSSSTLDLYLVTYLYKTLNETQIANKSSYSLTHPTRDSPLHKQANWTGTPQ